METISNAYIIPFLDFIAEPSNELMYTFSNKDVVLFCASKNPVHMNGTLNGKRLDESYFKYSTNESLVLVYSATFEAEANSLKPLDSLVITCSNDLQLDLIGRDVAAGAFHTWNFDILGKIRNHYAINSQIIH